MSELRIQPSPTTHWKMKDGEAVVVDFASGHYFVLDDVCAFYWQRLMEKPHTVEELVDATLEEYEAEREEVRENIERFYTYVLGEKLAERA